MGDEIYCPECREPLQLMDKCVCGWRREKQRAKGRCYCVAVHSDGSRCYDTPVTFEGRKGFCRKHWEEKKKFIRPASEHVEDCLSKIYSILGKKHLIGKTQREAHG
jgi:hypothetical protein